MLSLHIYIRFLVWHIKLNMLRKGGNNGFNGVVEAIYKLKCGINWVGYFCLEYAALLLLRMEVGKGNCSPKAEKSTSTNLHKLTLFSQHMREGKKVECYTGWSKGIACLGKFQYVNRRKCLHANILFYFQKICCNMDCWVAFVWFLCRVNLFTVKVNYGQ